MHWVEAYMPWLGQTAKGEPLGPFEKRTNITMEAHRIKSKLAELRSEMREAENIGDEARYTEIK